jgi:hypothetical protein
MFTNIRFIEYCFVFVGLQQIIILSFMSLLQRDSFVICLFSFCFFILHISSQVITTMQNVVFWSFTHTVAALNVKWGATNTRNTYRYFINVTYGWAVLGF